MFLIEISFTLIVDKSLVFTMSVVVSVRVKRELKEEAERLGINIKEVFEKALKNAIENEKRKKLSEAVKNVLKHLDIGEDEWIKLIRETRDER